MSTRPQRAARPRGDGESTGAARGRFSDFYDAHAEQVATALAVTLRDRQLGGEAAQEAMTRAWQRWRHVGAMTNPAGWAYRVGLNWARSRWRKLRRERLGAVADRAQPPPRPPDPTIARAVDELDDELRDVVVLRFLLDWSVDATAEAVGIPPGTVKSRTSRALAQLRDRLGAETTAQPVPQTVATKAEAATEATDPPTPETTADPRAEAAAGRPPARPDDEPPQEGTR